MSTGSKITSKLITSSCKEGTVLKGINIFSGKSDPIAKPDSEYPSWLWSLLDKAKEGGSLQEMQNRNWTLQEQMSARYLRLTNRLKIRENALKSKK
jgi:large subunit ribosomal protein L54